MGPVAVRTLPGRSVVCPDSPDNLARLADGRLVTQMRVAVGDMGHRVGGSNNASRTRGGTQVQRLDGEAVRAWVQAATTALDAARGALDSLNVFPVPDADTGTNLYLTLAQGADEVAALDAAAPAAELLAAFAHGALVGARGNSGVIASQFLLGLARGFDDGAVPDGVGLARALDGAQRAARTAVARPVDGTILTAATVAASAAREAADAGAELDATASAALHGAREALARTRDELPALRAAGVVDAGAAGLVVILEALVGVLTGRPVPGIAQLEAGWRRGDGSPDPASGEHAAGGEHAASDDLPPDGEFEVMFLVESSAPDLASVLSARLQAIGESVAVVGGPGVWQVHVHTDDPAAAVAAGGLGRQRQITVRHLGRHAAQGHARGHGPADGPADGPAGGPRAAGEPAGADAGAAAGELGLVVGTRAPALIRELARTGAVVMVLTGAPASTASVRRAVVDTGAAQVAVLPGSPDARVAALAAAAPGAGHARPSRGGRPAIQIHVLDAVDDARVVAGLAAAVASRSARQIAVGAGVPVGAGESAGIPAELAELAAIRAAVDAVRTADVDVFDFVSARAAADELLAAGGELLTVLTGAGADDAVVRSLRDYLSVAFPEVEVIVLAGGQLTPAVLLAVE